MPLAGPTKSPSELAAGVRARIAQLKALPTAAAVALRLFELGRGEGADAAEYARVIAADAGLAARLLAVANSPWVGLRNRITRPVVAVNLLGTAAVRTLALNFCISGLHSELRLTREEGRAFWSVALCKALAARSIAQMTDPAVGEDAYIAGLLQDIALPVMFSCDRETVDRLLARRDLTNIQRLARERVGFSADHAELGQSLARHLGLTETQCRIVGAHHDLAALQKVAASPALAEGVYAAALFPHRLDHWNTEDAEALRRLVEDRAAGSLSVKEFLHKVGTECSQLFAYFDEGQVTEFRLGELLAAATAEAADDAVRLVGATREMAGQVASAGHTLNRMMEQQLRLEEEAARDPMTGALNRAGFNRQAQLALARLQQVEQPAAVIFLDVDRFKTVNDTCGHPAGDEALRQVVEAIRACTRGTDIVARVGGDEFVVLLPNCPEQKAQEIAERLRKLVTMRILRQLDGGMLRLSISIGLVQVPAGTLPDRLDELVGEADRRMYEAKKSGGDRVRCESLARTA